MQIPEKVRWFGRKILPVLIGLSLGFLIPYLRSFWNFLQNFARFRLFGHMFQVADLGVGWLMGISTLTVFVVALAYLSPKPAPIVDDEEDEDVLLDDADLTREEIKVLNAAGIRPVVWVTGGGVVWTDEVDTDTRDRLHNRILSEFPENVPVGTKVRKH